ncbi:MAG: quinolinate synthase NadA, partial [Deltaproteobacteria bacterium]|nr:quinolinate synthase NadA [Deltaproteobacteria bacterium]
VADFKAQEEIKALADGLLPLTNPEEYLSSLGAKKIVILPGALVWESGRYSSHLADEFAVPPCQIHAQIEESELHEARRAHPLAKVVVNRLCLSQVKALADFIGDAQELENFIAKSEAREFILVTESGLGESLRLNHPGKKIHELQTEMFCPNMKLTNIKDILAAMTAYTKDGSQAFLKLRAVSEVRQNNDLFR